VIAAAFCMFNRYVDGLDTWQPQDAEFYGEVGSNVALGYVARDWKQPLQTVSSNRAAPARPNTRALGGLFHVPPFLLARAPRRCTFPAWRATRSRVSTRN